MLVPLIASTLFVSAVPHLGLAQGGEVERKGVVLNAEGQPAKGVTVSSIWLLKLSEDGRTGHFEPKKGAVTDENGQFTILVNTMSRTANVMALDVSGKLGGTVAIATANSDAIEVKLQPLRPITLEMKFEGFKPEKNKVAVQIETLPKRAIISGFHVNADAPPFTVELPAGDYQIVPFSFTGNVDESPTRFTIPSSGDAKTVPIKINVIAAGRSLDGKALAWNVTAARGLPKTAQVSDFKGKWVLIDFWATWCGPCVGNSLPELAEFWRGHPELKDKVMVVAFHDGSAKDFTDLDKKLKPIKAKLWGGKDLPFPVLRDSTGKTIKDWGIQAYPTTVLIDPAGNFVPNGSLAKLKKVLGL